MITVQSHGGMKSLTTYCHIYLVMKYVPVSVSSSRRHLYFM